MFQDQNDETLLNHPSAFKDDPQVRLGFIKKTFGILTAQLWFTSVFVLMVMSSDSLQKMLLNPLLLILVIVSYIASICALACCGFDRKVPVNYALLMIFTFDVSYLVSLSTMKFPPLIVFEASMLTATMVLAITFYAATTKNDFTICGPALFIVGFVFSMASILGFVLGGGETWHLLTACMGVIIFSFYLLVDVQMIMGGKNKRYTFDTDSYILASVALYLDIVNIFLYILQILASLNN